MEGITMQQQDDSRDMTVTVNSTSTRKEPDPKRVTWDQYKAWRLGSQTSTR